MIHTSRVRTALQFAARKHHGQFRKESELLPYITHPVSVAILLADANADEDTIIAGLLHDTIEDTKTIAEEITNAFGARVTELVISVSEPKQNTDGSPTNWRERKEAYLNQLSFAEDAAVLISMADKIDNIESELENSAHIEDTIYSSARWYEKPESYFWFHGAVLQEAQKRNITGSLRDRLELVTKLEHERFENS